MGSESSPARVTVRLSRVVEIGLARVDLTPSQYRILVMLSDGAAQASKMADHLNVSRPSVTAVVDGLVARGLVDRRHDEQDRRRVGHTLTDAGRLLLEEADASVEKRLMDVLEHAKGTASKRVALQGLAAWEHALDGYRTARKASRDQEAVKTERRPEPKAEQIGASS